ncbi:hypothetical protein JCM18237_07520 [Halorubrum luteum]
MERLSGFLAELVELLVIVIGAGAAAVAGIALELFGLGAVTGGDVVVGIWSAGMGAIALYVGVVALGYEHALPRLRRLLEAE